MSNLILHRAPGSSNDPALPLPSPRVAGGEVQIREATMNDLAFIDELQKKHTKMVGFFPRPWFENNIASGHVLIAEGASSECPGARERIGYCIYKDRYLKREELGIVYQLNVAPGKRRGLVGAALVKAAFERCPYGVKLFCCWCAQDIEANHFWESIGFVPIAFRTGSRGRGKNAEPRIHIFWQRRIREGDTETPYWFPSETSGGAVRENRLVLPIPPGTHWSDAKPAVLPGMEKVWQNLLEGDREKQPRKRGSKRKPKPAPPAPPAPPPEVHSSGMWFAPPEPPAPPESPAPTAEEKKAEAAKRKAERKQRQKNDPKLVAAARELRDRYIEQINAGLLLPPSACGKYDVSRALEEAPSVMHKGESRLLDAA